MSVAIRIEGLGKRYAINRGGGGGDATLRNAFGRALERLSGRRRAPPPVTIEESAESKSGALAQEFWALRDITLDIREGERVGIIGPNGAGKSTLLKILSRITAPTEGRVEIRGKVASLLEVGTGFHPELSGRENVYLNGAILGMSHTEIRKKFDEIVEFSGVAKFLDTPVKHYSSGMYVRLAFAVSAWLDPDILIVDEVLAVGDAAFQKKCAERMKELTREGRTVLFVSHSMATVNQMCQQALYLEAGRVMSYGPVVDQTREYNRDVIEQIEIEAIERFEKERAAPASVNVTAEGLAPASRPRARPRNWSWHRAQFTLPHPQIEVQTDYPGAVDALGGEATSPDGEIRDKIPIEQPIHITLRYRINRDLERSIVPSFNFFDELGTTLFIALPDKVMPGLAGEYAVTCIVPPFLINPGRVTVNLNLSDFHADRTTYIALASAVRVELSETDGMDPRRHGFDAPVPGFFRPRLEWRSGRI